MNSISISSPGTDPARPDQGLELMGRQRRTVAVLLTILTVLAILLNAAVDYLIHSTMAFETQQIADQVITPDQRTVTGNIMIGWILAVALQSAAFVLIFMRFIFADTRN